MANVYSPESLGISPPSGGFAQGGWYEGRHYWGGTLSDPGVLHPQSGASGAGELVSPEVNRASAALQGVSYPQFESYLQQQRQKSAGIAPTASYAPTSGAGMPALPSGEAGAGMPALQAQPTINLPELYKGLYQESGIEELQTKYSEMEKQYIEAKANIDDNPFLSEATRVGRIAKIEKLFDERTANIRNEIATKKADVETKLNLQMKQFDIQSEQTRLAWDQFNTLLSMGALDNASGESIASITRSTGISSDMIYSAIAASKKKNANTEIIQIDDGTNIKAVLLDKDTGQVLNTSILSASKPKAGKAVTEAEKTTYYQNLLRDDAASGMNLNDIMRLYTGYLDPNTIYYLYNATSMFGAAKESPEELAKWGVTVKDFNEGL